MSRTDKDQPWRLAPELWKRRYWSSGRGHGAWKRGIRRVARARADDDLRNSREPQPVYPIERVYYD